MPNKIILKKSSVAAKVPLTSDLDIGEIAVNLTDQKLYSKDAGGSIVVVGSAVPSVLGTPGSGNLSNCTVDGTNAVGFRNIPINSQTGNYPLVLADAGKAILHPSGGAAQYTIPANGTVAYPIGTSITFINLTAATVTIIPTDIMYLAGVGTQGNRTLAQYGIATAVKLTATDWIISGNGLT
jgi:hypothetical protein